MKTLLSLLMACLLFSCSSTSQAPHLVGIDPSWYPLRLEGLDTRITAFSSELLTAIGEKEEISFARVTVDWEDLMQGLQKGEYEAILSSMPPYLFNQKLFSFSSVYLHLGPVLVVRASSSIESLDTLAGQEIAVIQGSSNDLLLEKSEGVLIRYYDSIPRALDALVNDTIDGALINVLSANLYLRDLYQKELKIVTPPLTDEGLRLITKYNAAPKLIKTFNAGLKDLQEGGTYHELLDKWGLYEESVN